MRPYVLLFMAGAHFLVGAWLIWNKQSEPGALLVMLSLAWLILFYMDKTRNKP